MELTRSDCAILSFLHKNDYTNQYRSATLQEIMKITKNSRPTTYRKMMNLFEQKFVGKGCKAVNADTFYVLKKGIDIVGKQESNASTRQIKNDIYISYENNLVRTKLLDIMDRGMMLKAVAVNSGISESELSRFKNGVDALKESDVKLLADYLNAVYIPRWNDVEKAKPEKKKSTRDLLFM